MSGKNDEGETTGQPSLTVRITTSGGVTSDGTVWDYFSDLLCLAGGVGLVLRMDHRLLIAIGGAMIGIGVLSLGHSVIATVRKAKNHEL